MRLRQMNIICGAAIALVVWDARAQTNGPGSVSNAAAAPPPGVQPSVTITATDPDASEIGPQTGTFEVTRTGPTTNALTVFYTIGGTASNGHGYQMISNNVTIPSNSTSNTITIFPILDQPLATPQLTDTVVLQLTPPPTNQTPYTIGSPSNAVVTIVEAPADTTNMPPEVQLLAPDNGAVSPAGGDLVLIATASAAATNNSVTNVLFFVNQTPLGQGAPVTLESEDENQLGGFVNPADVVHLETFIFKWRQVPAGQYSITAVATDNQDATAVSAPAQVTVQGSGGAR